MKKVFVSFIYKLIFILLIVLSASSIQSPAADSCLGNWQEFTHSAEKIRLGAWMKSVAENILLGEKKIPVMDFTLPAEPGCTGLFITLIKSGKVRGCYGAFSHRYSDPSMILKSYIKGALSLDPRHKPVERDELEDIEIILTVASNPEPVGSLNNVDISNFGLLIECEGTANFVIVPAEYRTLSGIEKLTGKLRCRYYRFRAVTVR